MWAKAFCPGHITGFFEICDGPSDPLEKGSRGAGVSIARGVTTEVVIQESSSRRVDVTIDGRLDAAPVTKSVVDFMSELHGESSHVRIRIDHTTEVPVGCGMGSSGAGAWGAALALNQLLKLGLTHDKIGQIAHRAEVQNRTGLGTVIAQQKGGIEIRSIPGGPGIGHVDQIPFNPDLRVICSSKGAISTRSMLTDPKTRAMINKYGGDLVRQIADRASHEELMRLSRKFSEQTELLSRDLQSGMKLLGRHGFHDSSMALFGETIFSLVWSDETEKVLKILTDWNKQGKTFSAEIDVIGARLTGCERDG